MTKPAYARLTAGAMALILVLLVGATAHAAEVQLAGIRLGQHAVNLLDVYGTPDGVVTGEGQEIAAPAAGGAPGMGGGMGVGMPGMGAGMPGMGGGGAPALMGGMPGMPGMGGPGGMPGMPGMPGAGGPGGMPGMPGMPGAGGPGGMPGMPGMPGAGGPGGMPGMPGAGGPGGGAGGAGAVSAAPFPIWGFPVWVTLRGGEVEWLYRKYGVVMGFVLDRDGFIQVIAVAAEDCNYARTSLWAPHKFIKLGDDFSQVVYRYGYPDQTLTFDGSGTGEVGTGGGSVTFSVNGTSRVFARDCVLRYHDSSNISFTLHNMKVTRIHIWRK